MSQETQPQYAPLRCKLKQVNSGDCVTIRDEPKSGPPKEKTVYLAHIITPKLGRIPTSQSEETKDEPYAWEAREFLREKMLGKTLCYVTEYKISGNDRECGLIYIGNDTTGENVVESLINAGLAEVSKKSGQNMNDFKKRLTELEDAARTAKKGKHSEDPSEKHIRKVTYTAENPKILVDSFNKKPIKAIIERVRDGSTLRVMLLPEENQFYNITVMMSGIRCPKEDEIPCGNEAKIFTESRLLQTSVEIILESNSNNNYYGTVLHRLGGNIAEHLLKKGLARCVDWSLASVTSGKEKLRAAEKFAKEQKLGIWKEYVPSGITIDPKDKQFQGKVIEVINADTLMVKTVDGKSKKIFLSSIRPPRSQGADDKPVSDNKNRARPLYDIPFMYDAREYLRKKLVGKKVNVVTDYIQPARDKFPEKSCCTVTIGGINVAEALVSKGLATVVRYKQDNDQRSNHYDELLSAESKAQKSGKGLHSKQDAPTLRVVDLTGDLTKSKQFLPFLQRGGRIEAVVEFVASGSRLRLFTPKEKYLFTFLLGGITCPRASRTSPQGEITQGEPWGDEALTYTKDLVLQREVEIVVESMDKAGNFIGWLMIEGVNLSVALVGEGLAKVHFTGERSVYAKELQDKQDQAKAKKLNIFSEEDEETKEEDNQEEDTKERKIEYKTVYITDIKPDLNFYAQYEEEGPQVEEMLEQLRGELTATPPTAGAYVPKKGELCAARFQQDGLWYRTRVEKITDKGVQVFYVDFGNRELTESIKLAALPYSYSQLPYAAHEHALAFVKLPKDMEILEETRTAFYEDTNNRSLKLNVEYRVGGIGYVSLSNDEGHDIAEGLVKDGLLEMEPRRESCFADIQKRYRLAQEEAKRRRVNLWQYGDNSEDDAREFGLQR